MSADLIALVPHLSGTIEKLGIVGVLIIAIGYLIWDRTRLMKEMRAAYRARDKWRLGFVKYKTVCDAHVPPIHIDMNDMQDLLGELTNGS